MENNIDNENRIEKEPQIDALYIDDDEALIMIFNRELVENKNIFGIACDTVEKALAAIDKYNPKILFIDHSFHRGGDEGLEVVRELKRRGSKIKIYSVTSDTDNYEKYGNDLDGNVDKKNYAGIESLVKKLLSAEIK